MEVDLIENGNILLLIDLERIFTSNSQIIQILRHKSKESKTKKISFRIKHEIEALPLKNYRENLMPKSPEIVGETQKETVKSNLMEIYEIINDLAIYKEVVRFITKDIYSEDHVFYELKTIFNNYFLQKYDKSLKMFSSPIEKSPDLQEINKSLKKAIFDIQQFTRLFLEVIYFFYNIKSLLGETNNPIFSLKNLTYFLIVHVFSNNTSRIICDMFKSINSSKEQKLQQNLDFFRGVSNLRLFGVPLKYCLDKTQIEPVSGEFSLKGTAHFNFLQKDSNVNDRESEFFSAKGSIEKKLFLSIYSFGGRVLFNNEDYVNDNYNNSNIKENSIVERDLTENSDDQQFFEVNGEFSTENNIIPIHNDLKESNSASIFSKDSKEEIKGNNNHNNNHEKKKFGIEKKPIDKYYTPAILSLESMANIKSSLNKIKILKKTIQKIYFCIHSFYKENHLNLPTELDNMEIISIFIYVIVNAKVPDVLAECDIIENFTLCNIFESIGGYYYVIFKLILQFFMEVDINSIKDNDKDKALYELCQSIIEKLRNPDQVTKEMILNIKKNVHKNYKIN